MSPRGGTASLGDQTPSSITPKLSPVLPGTTGSLPLQMWACRCWIQKINLFILNFIYHEVFN